MFLRSGMAAWMIAWSQCLPATGLTMPRLDDSERHPLPDVLRGKVASLLAEMALTRRLEA